MGKRISKARKEREMKQIELAGELGISVDQMSNIENGRAVCKTEYIYLIEQILDVSATYLLHGTSEIEEKNELMKLLSKLSPEQIRKSKVILETAFL
jgi:transcriptional regulator with XRE-family HTH domain